MADPLIENHQGRASRVHRAQHVAVGRRDLTEHLGVGGQQRDGVGRNRLHGQRFLHLFEDVGAFLEQAAFLVFLERADAVDGGARIFDGAVDRARHAVEVLEHGFESRTVLDVHVAEVGDFVLNVLEAHVDGFDLVLAFVATCLDLNGGLRLRRLCVLHRGLELSRFGLVSETRRASTWRSAAMRCVAWARVAALPSWAASASVCSLLLVRPSAKSFGPGRATLWSCAGRPSILFAARATNIRSGRVLRRWPPG